MKGLCCLVNPQVEDEEDTTFKMCRDCATALVIWYTGTYPNPDDGTLTVYVRREMDVTEKILVKMKGKETLEKNLNL